MMATTYVGPLSYYMLCLLLWNFLSPCWSAYKDINQDCKDRLTLLDSHMATYVGVIEDIEATHDSGDVYRYVIGICIAVGGDKHGDCGIMQYDKEDSNKSHCLGMLTNTQLARSQDGVWIELTYVQGDRYKSHCNNIPRIARIVFLCDPAINGKGRIDFLEENNEDELCYYMFSVAAKAVCGYSDNLSVGDIILIIAAALLFVWLLAMAAGLVFKRFMLGAKSWEQVPLLDWYRAFGNLEADGCDFVCRTRSTKLVEYKEPSFGADTDEEDDEKDDNLLPM